MFRGARKVIVPLVALLTSVALAAPAAATVRTAAGRGWSRAAEVRLGRDVRLGQFSQAVVAVQTRCRPGFAVQELRIDLVQLGGDRGSRTGDFGIVCDGAWHQLSVFVNTPDGGPFRPGWTKVFARLTVVEVTTGAQARPARDAISDFVHGQAEVKVSRDVRLGQEDAALVTVFVRCERPWIAQPMVVSVAQDEGFTNGSAVHDGIVCDDRWHRIDLRVYPSDERFHRGLTTVDASLDVLDPIDFDPVEQATDSVTGWVDAAADVKIARHARVEADGTLLLPVWARCQEPWVVQGLSVDLFQEDTGAGGSASGEFGLSCDGRWRRVEVPVEPAPGPFLGSFVAHAFFTVLDPVSFDPVDQAQDTEDVDTPFSNGASNCLEDEDLNAARRAAGSGPGGEHV
jgi:hypothetical protein